MKDRDVSLEQAVQVASGAHAAADARSNGLAADRTAPEGETALPEAMGRSSTGAGPYLAYLPFTEEERERIVDRILAELDRESSSPITPIHGSGGESVATTLIGWDTPGSLQEDSTNASRRTGDGPTRRARMTVQRLAATLAASAVGFICVTALREQTHLPVAAPSDVRAVHTGEMTPAGEAACCGMCVDPTSESAGFLDAADHATCEVDAHHDGVCVTPTPALSQ